MISIKKDGYPSVEFFWCRDGQSIDRGNFTRGDAEFIFRLLLMNEFSEVEKMEARRIFRKFMEEIGERPAA